MVAQPGLADAGVTADDGNTVCRYELVNYPLDRLELATE